VYGYESWSLAVKEGHALRVCKNRAQSRVLGPKREGTTGDREYCRVRSFIICTLYEYYWGDQIKGYEM
jgi:hypothetical protein